jgi:hypothetical protein
MKNEIKLVQSPVITHDLVKVGKSVTKRLKDLNIDNLVATIDTVKALKEMRTTLNKEFSEYEDQRKFIDTEISKPYKELKVVYEAEITEKYSNAINTLKEKIAFVENGVKEEKEANIKLYFIELCQSEDIDFITFDKVGLDINLSTTEKAYKEKINKFIAQICSDVDLIKSMDFEAETMAEYKVSLNASESIKDVKDRKERERQEAIRIKAIEQNRRITEFKNIGMDFDTELKTFNFNEEIYISADKIKDISKEDFANTIIEFEEKIKVYKKSIEEPVEKVEPKKETKQPAQKTIEKPVKKEPLKAPVKEEKLEIVIAQFEVEGTLPQLKALGEYMKSNNLTYKNID